MFKLHHPTRIWRTFVGPQLEKLCWHTTLRIHIPCLPCLFTECQIKAKCSPTCLHSHALICSGKQKHIDTCLVAASFFCRCSMVSSATLIFLRASSSASFLLSFLSLSSNSRTLILNSSTWSKIEMGIVCNLKLMI